MAIPTLSYLDEKGQLAKQCPVEISEEILERGYRIISLTRYIDERMVTLQRQGIISFAMSSRGEEACAVAAAAALASEDWIYPQYRESGAIFWRGFTPQEYIHHMFCNAQDIIKGRQMPNHFGARKHNVVTVSSPIGTKIPHAAGCAYAMKLQGEKSVALCFFGEGASSEGDFHVGLNFAAVLKAPVIFFCRNNSYAISTPASRQFATDGVAPEGIGHGITTTRVDGNDFFAVYGAVEQAKAQCLQGRGPVFIEAMTYRLGAHSTSDDPTRYRKSAECELWEKRCPLLRLGLYLKKRRHLTAKQQKEMQEAIQQEVEEAIERAKNTPPPALQTLIEDVYFEVPHKLIAQLEEVQRSMKAEEDR